MESDLHRDGLMQTDRPTNRQKANGQGRGQVWRECERDAPTRNEQNIKRGKGRGQ